jgi:hypothetical protein
MIFLAGCDTLGASTSSDQSRPDPDQIRTEDLCSLEVGFRPDPTRPDQTHIDPTWHSNPRKANQGSSWTPNYQNIASLNELTTCYVFFPSLFPFFSRFGLNRSHLPLLPLLYLRPRRAEGVSPLPHGNECPLVLCSCRLLLQLSGLGWCFDTMHIQRWCTSSLG